MLASVDRKAANPLTVLTVNGTHHQPQHTHLVGEDGLAAVDLELALRGPELAEALVLEPRGEEDHLRAAPLPVLARQPDERDHLLERLVGGVHEGLFADPAAEEVVGELAGGAVEVALPTLDHGGGDQLPAVEAGQQGQHVLVLHQPSGAGGGAWVELQGRHQGW